MKKLIFRLLMTALIVPLAGCGSSNQFVPPPPAEVTVCEPIAKDVTVYTEIPGRTDAKDFVEVRARVRGFLESIDFTPGTVVQAGQKLFSIEAEPYQAALDSAKAMAERARASLELARVTEQRKKQLFEEQAIAELEYLASQAELEQAQAALAEAEAAIKNAEIDLDYTEITAPIGGRISRNLVSVGNLVGAGEQTLLTTIAQEDPIYVYVNLSERLMLPILGQRARAGNAPLPEDEDHMATIGLVLSDGSIFDGIGEFDYGDNKVDPNTGTIEVRAVFPNKNGVLVPGMFVKVRVPEEKSQALLVPQEAVMRDMIGYYVLLVNDQNIVERRSVETGRKVEHLRIIESGLDPSDRVVINGLLRARPGAEVKPVAGTILEPQGNQ